MKIVNNTQKYRKLSGSGRLSCGMETSEHNALEVLMVEKHMDINNLEFGIQEEEEKM
jgi:hypothetical protein